MRSPAFPVSIDTAPSTHTPPCCSVSSAEDVLMLLQQGGHNRAVRGTELNEASSRSHALLQVSVEVESAQEGGSTVLRRAKLNMVRPEARYMYCTTQGAHWRVGALQVDLAGSEKWNTKLSLGARRAKELTHINQVRGIAVAASMCWPLHSSGGTSVQSLSALGNCIAALTEKNRSHVPFRDSKLTRLLQVGGVQRFWARLGWLLFAVCASSRGERVALSGFSRWQHTHHRHRNARSHAGAQG